jgi:ribosomal protein L14E/L6E/L27E
MLQVVRQVMPLKRLSLTPFKVDIPSGARLSTLVKAYKVPHRPRHRIAPLRISRLCASPTRRPLPLTRVVWQASGVEKSWAESSWAKGLAKKAAKGNLTDMDRFKLMVARKTRARVVNKAMKAMKKK